MITPDQKFVQKLQILVAEVLSDEAKFFYRKDEQFATLHNKVFSKAGEMAFANLQPLEKASFKKYFYLNNNTGTPRQDVPFTDSAEDQAFFFDQLRNQVKYTTFGFDRMEFVRPSFADDKATSPTFNQAQNMLLVRGIVYPLVFSIEQREIAAVEKQKSNKVVSEGDEKKENPFDQLADKILVQGQSGQFDVVLTYAQLEEIAIQEAELRKQGLDNAKVVELLGEYIKKRFPDLNMYLTPEGKVITFLSATGISASGNLNGKNAAKSPTDLPEPLKGGQSFTELVQEMKLRQGRKLQYDAVIASKGALGFSSLTFQVGTATTLNGLSMDIDQSGQGNNAVFFVTDRQGVAAKVIVDTAAYRNTGKPDYNFKMYEKPEIDSPISPKIKLPKDDLPTLQTPLLVLYGQLQGTESYGVVSGVVPKGPQPLDKTKPPQLPTEGPDLSQTFGPGELPGMGVSYSIKPKLPKVALTQGQLPGTAGTYSGVAEIPTPKPKPKLDLTTKGEGEAKVEGEGEQPGGAPGKPGGIIKQPGTKGKLPAGQPALSGAGGAKKGFPAGALVAITTGVPIAGTLIGGIVQIIINS